MDEREQLEQAINALEAQRAILGDAVLKAALSPMREKLAALQVKPQDAEQQRKQVSVLFADVSGFTAMSETMDPEEVSATMNALWRRLDTAITSHSGRVDKHIGDAVMAIFGAPTAHEDDPERAVRAALDMQSELNQFRESANFDSARALQMRIGINTGPVLLGRVGTTSEYTAMGDTVNLASRMEHAAPVGGILISHDTYRHIRGVFEVVPLEPISVKGKTDLIQVYVVKSAKPRAFRVSTRGVEGIETRTIGRESELDRLQEAFHHAKEHHQTQLVTIVGEAGVGKSRLLYEFTNWLQLQPDNPFLSRGRATHEMMNLPYSLIRNMLAFQFEIQESDRSSEARNKLERGFADIMGPDSAVMAHFVGHLIGLDFSSSPYLQGILNEARQIRDRAFHYLAQLFTEVAHQHQVAVIVLEDIHWADDGSLNLVDHLIHEQPDLPLLIVSLARSTLFERWPTWGEGPITYTRLDLHPLSEENTRQLVSEILRKVPEVPTTLQELIVGRAEGNAFYVEELIKMLIDDRVIVTNTDQWHVETDRLAAVRVPSTLTGVLQSRLDGLPALEREALQQASVVGRVFWGNIVERLHNPEAEQLESTAVKSARLSGLADKELIFKREPSAFAQTPEFIFKHAILHDVTYESVLRRLRRAYHAQVAASLIELSGERVTEYAGRIGEHYELASEVHLAAEWYGRAGRQAQETYAPETAIDYYQKALAAWPSDAELIVTDRHFEVYDGLGQMLVAQARYAEAIETYTAMRTLAEASRNAINQARAWRGLALTQTSQGDHRAAFESTVQAETIARAANERRELGLALLLKCRTLFRLGEAEATLKLGEQLLALSTELGDRRQIARTSNLMGSAHYIQGRYAQAKQFFEEALAVCEELGDRVMVMDLSNNLGVMAEARGDYHLALSRYQEALRIAHEIGHRDGELFFLSNLGAARIGLGEYAAAETDLQQVIKMATTTGSSVLSDTYHFLAEARLGQGKRDEALAAARQALTLGQEGGSQEYTAMAWRVLGQVAAQLPESITIEDKAAGSIQRYDAAACFNESVRICTEAGMEGERARTLRAWAQYELERGDQKRGEALWQEARELFAKLGADLEVERMAELPLPRKG